MYLVGKECKTGQYVYNASSCALCKRLIINSGIDKIVIRDTKTNFRSINVTEWIENDDSLSDNPEY